MHSSHAHLACTYATYGGVEAFGCNYWMDCIEFGADARAPAWNGMKKWLPGVEGGEGGSGRERLGSRQYTLSIPCNGSLLLDGKVDFDARNRHTRGFCSRTHGIMAGWLEGTAGECAVQSASHRTWIQRLHEALSSIEIGCDGQGRGVWSERSEGYLLHVGIGSIGSFGCVLDRCMYC